MDQNAIPPSQRLDPVRWPAERLQPWPRAKIAIGWNVAVIVVGALIAVIGLINGLAADPENSALRQTVAALWVIQGLFGMLIAVVGILGATLVHGLRYDQQAGRPQRSKPLSEPKAVPAAFSEDFAREEERLRQLGNRPADR